MTGGIDERRLLLVHAHPDDEIGTGATIAHYVAAGAHVTVLTRTLGEWGEILVPELAELEATRGDQLGGYRMGEMAAAMTALGVLVAEDRFALSNRVAQRLTGVECYRLLDGPRGPRDADGLETDLFGGPQ